MTTATRHKPEQSETAQPESPAADPPAVDPQVMTFGCRLNAYESEVMLRQARLAGLGEAVIVNTCAVTGEAERQARQAIRRAKRERPDAKIVVAGCAAQLHPDSFAQMPEVDRVLGNQAKLRLESYAPQAPAKIVVEDIMEARETASHLVQSFEARTRAFVQIQQGCDHRCTFCIIPFARGNNRSVPIGQIVQEIRQLVQNGVREVVLTGVDITGYGPDLPGKPTLGQLCRRLLQLVPELPRLRLTSVDPVELDEDVFRLLESEPRLMGHLHLSLQAGDDLILKRMKRRHSLADAQACVERARAARPDVVFGADIIAGFPTEDEARFQTTLEAVDTLDLTWLHVFPYSERPGTPAAKMPAVSKAERKDRARRLREAGERRVAGFLASRVGKVETVLLEEPDDEGRMKGRSEQFAPMRVVPGPAGTAGQAGQIVRARVTHVEGGSLVAETQT